MMRVPEDLPNCVLEVATAQTRAETRVIPWNSFACASAAVLALGLGYFLFGMPVQLTDCVSIMLSAQASTLLELVGNQFGSKAFLRPFLLGQVKVLLDASGGHYFLTFKTFHVIQALVLLLLFVWLLRIRSRADAIMLLPALVVVVGIHTFAGTIREGFPVNTFMTILVSCVIAANMSASRGGWHIDVGAVLLFAYAALTLETGLLVWVIVVTGFLAGLRGVSWKGVMACTALFIGYFYLRFAVLDVGTPELVERSTGFGFSVREPAELTALFDKWRLPFYAYNVVSSFLSVLLTEPRAGVWEFTKSVFMNGLRPWILINVVSSVLLSTLIVRYGLVRWRMWLRQEFDYDDQLYLMFVAVLFFNAAISFPYTKDVIMSPAGVFYSIAGFVALRDFVSRTRMASLSAAARGTLLVLLAAMTTAWSIRAVGLGYNMRYSAFVQRNDWVVAHEWLAAQHIKVKTPQAVALVEQLRKEALKRPAPNPYFAQRWAEELFDKH